MIAPTAVNAAARILSRPPLRTARGSERSWTGRSVVTRATDRAMPRFATRGMLRTRVSETRDVASRIGFVRVPRALTGPATTSDTRRRPSSSPISG